MTKIHSPAGLSFLSSVKIGAPPGEKNVLESPVIQNSNAHVQSFRGVRDLDFD